jgi:D-sedoheptulose 7-phosphate isomerase
LHADRFLAEAAFIANEMDGEPIERLAGELNKLREKRGRLFLIGLGGSAANCQHAAADLRTLCEIDAYSLCDNFAAFSAQANDHGLDKAFTRLMDALKCGANDALLILSVGGGTSAVSQSITNALYLAQERKMRIYGIVGPRGGYTADLAHVVVKIPVTSEKHITPHSEAFQAVVWHALCCHPGLQRNATKW